MFEFQITLWVLKSSSVKNSSRLGVQNEGALNSYKSRIKYLDLARCGKGVGGNGGGWRGKRLDAGLTQYYKNIRNWAIKM